MSKISKVNFDRLNLSKDLLRAISDMGFKAATPIQMKAIPEVLSGYDIIGQASTGTGKTAAFAIPVIEKINFKDRFVQAIILCPTRELAIQVSGEISKLLKYKKWGRVLPVYGGQPIAKQLFALRKGPQIIVGTPGRTIDHLERGSLSLNRVKMVVLDEADEMLDMGFRQDLEQILQATPQERQTILFSATMSPEILCLTKRYQKNPKIIKVMKKGVSLAPIEQSYFGIESSKKKRFLIKLINEYKPKLSIVFCNTKRKVDEVSKVLRNQGYLAEGIHGDVRQPKRDRIMNRFRRNKINILVATGVAARGIDVPNVEIVFNYEIPREIESYVHRIGRTGRAGKTGKALSLVSRSELRKLHNIMRFTKTNIRKKQIS